MHEYNDKDTCILCGCSKSFIIKNTIICEPTPRDARYYMLQYGDIHMVYELLIDEKMDDTDDNVKHALSRVKPGGLPADKIKWYREQWNLHRDKFKKIYEKCCKMEKEDPDGFYETKYYEQFWDPNK